MKSMTTNRTQENLEPWSTILRALICRSRSSLYFQSMSQSEKTLIVKNAPARMNVFVCLFGLLFFPMSGRGAEPPASDKQLRVSLFCGAGDSDPFWELFAGFMEAASSDFGLELKVHFAVGDRDLLATQLREACDRSDRPDAVVVQGFKSSGLRSLRVAERYGVPALLINAGLTERQKGRVGEPRDRLKHWIGEILPNDFSAGFKLANALIDEAVRDPKRIADDGRVHLLGLNGVVSDSASIQRVAGLNAAMADRSDVAVLEQVITADWQQSLARSRCRILHRRYPRATVIWTASDGMAIGAIEAMEDQGLIAGKDVVIGGVDATLDAMDRIEQGTLYASVGGHFMEGAWAVVLLHDFLKGLDPAKIPRHYASPMALVTKSNLADYRVELKPSTWKLIDFRQFSRFDRPELDSYQFEMVAADQKDDGEIE